MLKVEGLTVRYGPVRAVDGIDLEVGDGEAVALLGPNGAGKTSTLAALSRLVPSGGAIWFDGRPLRRRPPDAVARAGLVHVPEGRRIFPNLSVHENLLVASAARSRRGSKPHPDEVYELFPALGTLRNRAGWMLSGGEQQMVAVGRALMGRPRMLLLDEPSLGLAPIVVDAVYSALARIREQVPILLVEQSTTLALELCDRAYVLSSGQIALAGQADDLAGNPELVASYLG